MASAWDIAGIPTFDKLKKDVTADVAIVGGGLAGFWCAYLLAQEGKRVVVLEKGRVGNGVTLFTTAFITQSIDTSLTELEKIFGRSTAEKVWNAGAKSIDLIEKVIKKEGIDCEFKRLPIALFARSEEEMGSLKEEHDLAKTLGFKTEFKRVPFEGFQNIGGMIIKNQAKYHPMKFFKGLVEASVEKGVEVFEKTEVTEIKGRSSFVLSTKGGKTIHAKEVIVATYQPFNSPKAVKLKKGTYESYVYELKMKHGLVPEGMYLDQRNPYHYLRVDSEAYGPKFDRIIVGGEDHRSELLKPLQRKSFKALAEFTNKFFAGKDYTTENKWHGGILEPTDGLALIGNYAPRQYLATAFSGNGMTYSAISGMIITDLIIGRKNEWSDAFDPKRKMTAKALYNKAKDYAGEFIGGAGKNIFK
jgi:glycine/D-amino acid oxidase-like deaminating enzyme